MNWRKIPKSFNETCGERVQHFANRYMRYKSPHTHSVASFLLLRFWWYVNLANSAPFRKFLMFRILELNWVHEIFAKIVKFVWVNFRNFHTVSHYLNRLCSIQSGPWAKTMPEEVNVGCSSGEILRNRAFAVWSSSDFCDAKNACMILRKFRGLPEQRSSLKTLKKDWKFRIFYVKSISMINQSYVETVS